jgi:hypothetical protein
MGRSFGHSVGNSRIRIDQSALGIAPLRTDDPAVAQSPEALLFPGVPYLLMGILLLGASFLDGVALADQFGLSGWAVSVIGAVLKAAFSTGLIGVIPGAVLIIPAITVTIIMNIIYHKKEETLVCSVPNAEIN